jgi:hypothetical protein
VPRSDRDRNSIGHGDELTPDKRDALERLETIIERGLAGSIEDGLAVDDHLIIHGDCRRLLGHLAGVDNLVIVTDPPYGIGYKHSGRGRPPTGRKAGRRHDTPIIGDDNGPFDPRPLLDLGRPIMLMGANHFHNRLPLGGSLIAWDKTAGGRGRKDSFVDVEFIWTSVPGIKRNLISHLRKGICCEKLGEANGKRDHPAQKPIGVMRRLIQLLDLPPNSVILDPYMGVGTTLIAAQLEGHRGVGIEIDPHYYRKARQQIEAALAQAGSGPPVVDHEEGRP